MSPKMPAPPKSAEQLKQEAEARAAVAARAKSKGKKAAPQPSEQVADHLDGLLADAEQIAAAPAPVDVPSDSEIDALIDQQLADERAASDHADQLEAAGLAAESYGSDDNTGKPDETNPHFDDLTYVDDGESQARPDDPHYQPSFESITPPPKKGKGKTAVKSPLFGMENPADELPAKKAKGGKKAATTPAPDALPEGHTIERDTAAPLPAVIADPVREIVDDKNFRITALGLRITGNPTFEEWADWNNKTGIIDNGMDWAAFDHMMYGEEHYGETAIQWAARRGGSAQTFYNKKSGLKRYSEAQRVFGVTLSAHIEAAKLEPMIRNMVLLEMQAGVAFDGKPMETISDLRRRMKQISDAAKPTDDGKGDDDKESDGDNETDGELEIDWETSPAGEYLYEHAGDGMLEAVIDDSGKLPESLRKLIKDKRFKGIIKVVIYLPKS